MFSRKDHLLPANIIRILCRTALLCICMLLPGIYAMAQKTDTGKITIHILNVRVITFNKTDSGEYNKFIDSVAFLVGTDTMYCDSAYKDNTTNNFEAFGDVKISQQDGTHGSSDYLRYTAGTKMAFMRGNVILVDGNNYLKCEELNYDLGTKTGEYFKGGTLQSDSTTVKSNTGIYNTRSKDARFKGNVIVTDAKYNIKSKDLGYNTETKVETFYDSSVVTSDTGKSVLMTTRGTYDSKHVIARFIGPSSVWNDGQYIKGDSLNYNKLTGYGLAIGNVVSIDTGHHSTLYCQRAEFFRKQRILWATIRPVLQQVNGKDTLYMRADTFYSAPMVMQVENRKPKVESDSAGNSKNEIPNSKSEKDSVANSGFRIPNSNKRDTTWLVPAYKYRIPDFMNDTSKRKPVIQYKPGANTEISGTKSRKSKVKVPKLRTADTSAADTSAPMFFLGYNHVLIFSDSLQGKCDSVCYTRSDSTIRMINTPIVWAHRSQITGDTILLYLDSNQLRKMYVPNNAFLVSQTGPDKAKLFDQVQGKTLTGYFKDNNITKMVVYPNAQCIYYSKDDSSAYLGVDEATSTRMVILFADQKITNISFYQDIHQAMTPLEKADLPNMKLSRFKWLIDQRPKTKEELFK